MRAFQFRITPNLIYFRLNQNLNFHTLFRIAKIGDKVAFNRKDATRKNRDNFSYDFFQTLKFKGRSLRYGTVTKIKTHSWLFFKLDKPVYVVDDYYLVEDVKPIIKKYASLHHNLGGLNFWTLEVS